MAEKLTHAEYCKLWRKKNADKFRESLRKYRKNNSDKLKQHAKKFREKNKEKLSRLKKIWYQQNKDKEIYKIKCKARKILNKAISDGIVVRPNKCENCGLELPIEGHHPDHLKPLEVKWLCYSCHKYEEVRKNNQEKGLI